MSLHETTVLVKKAGLGSVLGIIGIIIIVIFVRIGIMVYNYYFPPKIEPPTRVYGLLKPLKFPVSSYNNMYTYDLHTTSGDFPKDLPDRLSVFPIVHHPPNFLNLEKAKQKVQDLNFTGQDDINVVPEIQLADPYYEWDENKGFLRKIIFNINSFDFKMTSDYLSQLSVKDAQYISDEQSAIKVALNFLDRAELTPKDLDLDKTKQKDNSIHYITYPELYQVVEGPQGNTKEETTSLSKTQIIRVNFYQKNLKYDLITGEAAELKPKIPVEIPILYPHPPYSTMEFWIASSKVKADVAEAYFTHQEINTTDTTATYKLITPSVAYNDVLKKNKAYIASYFGSDNNVLINNIYLAYYLGEEEQDYLMPIYVFEGNNGFIAYVSALDPFGQIQESTPSTQ